VALCYAMLTYVVSAILPSMALMGVRNPTNPIYGFLYDLGWLIGSFLLPPGFPGVQSFGGAIWPGLVFIGVYVFYATVARKPERRLLKLVLLWFALIVVVPRSCLHWSSDAYLPTYEETLEAFY
jgi:hypothetical protein